MKTMSVKDLKLRLEDPSDFDCSIGHGFMGLDCGECIFNTTAIKCGGHSYDVRWPELAEHPKSLDDDKELSIDDLASFLTQKETKLSEYERD